MNRNEKKILGVTAASHNLVHLYEGVLPPLIPLVMAEFNTDYFHVGLVVTIFSYAFGIGALPAGWFSDKFRPRRLVQIFLFGAGIPAVLVGLTHSFRMYAFMMGVVGVFCSIYHPAANTLLSHSISEKGRAFGIHGIAGSLGVAMVPALAALIGATYGWRTSHVIFGLFGICVWFLSLAVRPETVSENAGADISETGNGNGVTVIWHQIILLFLISMFIGLTYKGIMTFLPVYMGKQIHLSGMNISGVAIGGTFATIALLSGALGQYFSGRLLDRHQPETLYLISIVICMVSVFIMSVSDNLMLIVASIVYAFFYFSTQPIQNFLIAKYLPRHRHGIGYGVHFFLSFGVGSTAAVFSGLLADEFGLQSVFILMGFCFAVSALLLLILVLRERISGLSAPSR